MTTGNRAPHGLLVGLFCILALLGSGCTNFNAQSRNANGVTLFQQGQYQQALQEFQEATYVDPGNPDAYYNLGATYHRLGRVQNQRDCLTRAEACYKQCLERDPNHADCHRGLAVLLVEEGRKDEAFRTLQAWAEQQPNLAEPKIELARLYQESGNKAAAEERLTEAVHVDPNNARQWAALGKIREDAGDYTQALHDYQQALALDYSLKDVAARIPTMQAAVARQTPPSTIPGLPPPPGTPGFNGPVVAGQTPPAYR
jgi:Flp pilus assembly protein TadD